MSLLLLPPSPFQIVSCFGFSMYLDIAYIYVHSKSYVPRKAKTTCNFFDGTGGAGEQLAIWTEGVLFVGDVVMQVPGSNLSG